MFHGTDEQLSSLDFLFESGALKAEKIQQQLELLREKHAALVAENERLRKRLDEALARVKGLPQ